MNGGGMGSSVIAHARQDEVSGEWLIHSLESHLNEAANFSGDFASKIGLRQIGTLLGLLHDVGKYSFVFQRYIKSAVGLLCKGDRGYMNPEPLRGQIDHSTAGAQWVCESLSKEIKIGRILKEIIALCGVSHHSGLIDLLDISGEDKLTIRLTKDAALTHYFEVKEKTDKSIADSINNIINSNEKNEQLKAVISQIHGLFDGQIRLFAKGLLTRFLFSCLIDADRISTADFDNPEDAKLRYLGQYPSWLKLIDCFESKKFRIKNMIDQKRCEVSLSCMQRASGKQGLYYLTVPTGGGKTFASLRFALHHAMKHKLDRIIYVIPYTSIIDQNASEVAKIFAAVSHEIVLEHHSNLVPDKDTQRNRILSENWDAPIVFTTSVQFLDTLFSGGTRSVRRMHQLAKSVIIFDEIQTLPIKTVHLFNNAINLLTGICSSTVVFCTATQPLLHSVDASKGAVPYSSELEIVDYPPLYKVLKRVNVQDCLKDGGWMEDELAERVMDLLQAKGSVLVVANTKATAKNLYVICKRLFKNVFHLSTSMCPKHRKDTLGRVLDDLDPVNPQPVICISTQLIEAGVDADFGAVIRCLAGLDSIAQAAGRCNRSGLQKNGLGVVQIVNLKAENLANLREMKIAQKVTLRILDEFRKTPEEFDYDLIGPNAMKRFYKYYFFQRSHEMSYRLSRNEIGRDDDMLSLLSTNFESFAAYSRSNDKAKPPYYLWQSFKTAGKNFRVIDAPTEGIMVPFNGEAKSIIMKLSSKLSLKEEKKLLEAAQQYSVNIFPYLKEVLIRKGVLFQTQSDYGILHLDQQHYSREFGVSEEPVSPMEFLNA